MVACVNLCDLKFDDVAKNAEQISHWKRLRQSVALCVRWCNKSFVDVINSREQSCKEDKNNKRRRWNNDTVDKIEEKAVKRTVYRNTATCIITSEYGYWGQYMTYMAKIIRNQLVSRSYYGIAFP